jgi:hypothetical protein
MTLSNEAELMEEPLFEGHPARALISSKEVVYALRGARDDAELIPSLLSDEGIVVKTIFDLLPELANLLSRAAVDPSVLPIEMGEVEKAHLTPDGRLIVGHRDGEILTTDLTDWRNRDLLVDILKDIVPKLRLIAEGKLPAVEPVPQEIMPEPVVQEPVLEPMIVEETREVKEPVLEPSAEAEFVEPLGAKKGLVPEKPVVEEIKEPERVAETKVGKTVLPKVLAPEVKEVGTPSVIERRLKETSPKERMENRLRRYRKMVSRNGEAIKRMMADIRRQRDAEIIRLRENPEERGMPEWGRQRGFLRRVKRLLSNLLE